MLALALAGTAGAVAQTRSAEEDAGVQPAPFTPAPETLYWLRVTGQRVNLRSRPDVNSRLVGRVNTDDVLEAVGREYGWYRIVPPDGVYSLVSARYIERLDQKRGRVKVDTSLRVRVGSDIQPRDPLLSEVQTRLKHDAEVQIIGELDENWLKIVPPKGIYAYISDKYAERVSAEVADRLRAAKRSAVSQPPASRPSGPDEAIATTQPVEQPDLTGRWGRRLARILPTIEAEQRKPAGKQRWDGILAHLRPIAKQRQEPQVARLAAAWIQKADELTRQKAISEQTGAIARQAEYGKARHERELEKIRRTREVVTSRPAFDARGVLRPSFALPIGPYGLRYKLQDPFTRKVQAYVEFPPELGIDAPACVGKYVGVRGESQTIEGVKVSILRVTHVTVLNPDEPKSPPAREKP